jgi:hypothetical protein
MLSRVFVTVPFKERTYNLMFYSPQNSAEKMKKLLRKFSRYTGKSMLLSSKNIFADIQYYIVFPLSIPLSWGIMIVYYQKAIIAGSCCTESEIKGHCHEKSLSNMQIRECIIGPKYELSV